MGRPPSRPLGQRETAEEKFDRVTKIASDSVEAERTATRKKIARLKAERLASEAEKVAEKSGKKKPSKPRR